METITITQQGQTFYVPLVVAFDRHGKPVDLVGDITPENCDHKGATWSSNLDMRCPRCGSRLFLPPRLLAYLPEEVIEVMHALWAASGWPEFHGGSDPGWSITPEHWTLTEHPLFAHVGGLPVRTDRAEVYADALRQWAA